MMEYFAYHSLQDQSTTVMSQLKTQTSLFSGYTSGIVFQLLSCEIACYSFKWTLFIEFFSTSRIHTEACNDMWKSHFWSSL